MTTTQLHTLNRDIDILYRHSLGETVTGIARLYSIHRNVVHRIINRRLKDQRIVEAVENRKALLYAGLEKGWN